MFAVRSIISRAPLIQRQLTAEGDFPGCFGGRPFTRRPSAPPPQEVSEPTKEEKAVAKYLRFNCPTKSTNMLGHRVDYFIG